MGLSLVAYQKIPTLDTRVATYDKDLDRLAWRVENGSVTRWPMRVGPFRFVAGYPTDEGIILRTSPTMGLFRSHSLKPCVSSGLDRGAQRLSGDWYSYVGN